MPPAACIGPTTMVHSRHTTKVFDADLQELARAIAEMGGLAERQIAEAIEALTTRDSGPARRIPPCRNFPSIRFEGAERVQQIFKAVDNSRTARPVPHKAAQS